MAKERPILFSAPMIRANRAGRKTQTRRLMNPQPVQSIMGKDGWDALRGCVDVGLLPADSATERRIGWTWGGTRIMPWPHAVRNQSPYGYPCDRLVVRETWRACAVWDETKPSEIDPGSRVWYEADGNAHGTEAGKLRPSIFLPRWASRDTYEITEVRAERLQDIGEDDAKAEGLAVITKDGQTWKYGIPDRDGLPGTDDDGWPWQEWDTDPRVAYQRLWDKINGDRAPWARNPWVWVVSYKPVPPESP